MFCLYIKDNFAIDNFVFRHFVTGSLSHNGVQCVLDRNSSTENGPSVGETDRTKNLSTADKQYLEIKSLRNRLKYAKLHKVCVTVIGLPEMN